MRPRILALLLAAAAAVAQAQIPPMLLMERRAVVNAAARGALCADGSPAAYYFRNCSANWDRKPGDPDFCAVEVVRWLVVFESGTGFCYDDASCAARAARDPNATSSQFYPSTLLPDGTLIPFAEVNPNVRGCDVGPLPRPHPPSPAQPAPHIHRFLPGIRVAQLYKSIAVFVPDCSGDLFAGNVSRASASHSRGLAIAQAVLEDLQTTSPSVLDADALTLFGPTGLIAHVDRVPGWLALGQRKNQSLTAVCDGCLLLGNFSSPIVPSPPCATDRDCPVAIALPRALSYWQAPAPTSCSATPSDLAACFLDTAVLRSASIAAVPILVQQPQFDALQLAPLVRAWPPAMTDPATHTLVVSFQKRVRQLLASTAYAFSAACDAPTGLAVDPAYYHISVNGTNSYHHWVLDAMGNAVPIFLGAVSNSDPASFGNLVEDCEGFDCNVSNCGSAGSESM